MAYAFRCRNCNSLAPAEHAGENERPHACTTCGRGVHFELENGQPVKKLDPGNWAVLADLEGDELAEVLAFHALEATDIVRHEPAPPADPGREPAFVEVSAEENPTGRDKVR